jgi:large subunit ribosomal protein L21e
MQFFDTPSFSVRRTGIVYNVTPSAVGVIVHKVVGNRYLEKRVNIRIEHVRHSKCRQEFLDRVKANHAARAPAEERRGEFNLYSDRKNENVLNTFDD